MNKLMAALAVLAVAAPAFAWGYGQTAGGLHEQMEAAIGSGNYSAWKDLHEGFTGKMMGFVTEENFPLFSKMHELMEEGRFDEAAQIRSELGMTRGFGQGGRGFGMGSRGGMPCFMGG